MKRYKPITRATRVNVPTSRVSKPMMFFVRFIARLYLCSFISTARVSLRGKEQLIDSFRRSLNKESRSILSFRHQNGAEPQILGWFVIYKLKRLAKKSGVKFARNPHLTFVHGYEVLRWGGPVARAVLPRLGALPVYHSKIDSDSMKKLFDAVFEGPHQLAIAPEGQVSYFTDSIPRIENGSIRIGFQAAEKLPPHCPVELLPVSVLMHYGRHGERRMNRLLRRIERYVGTDPVNASFEERLRRCQDSIFTANEKRYELVPEQDATFLDRANTLIEAALESTERILHKPVKGEVLSRMHALRQECWDRIFLPDPDSLDKMSELERSLADLQAGAAWYAGRHIELVDLLWYFRVPIPTDHSPLREKVEYVQNLWDLLNRTTGGAFSNRVNIPPDEVIISTESPINLSSRLDAYHHDRKSTIAAVAIELENAYRQSATSEKNEKVLP
ncbi:hypothetical protein FACS1894164_10330 [Spirochaetia bacterium]|nr:hypothetical protein FACS1894164_10330 [Spirochaetia bacterium]